MVIDNIILFLTYQYSACMQYQSRVRENMRILVMEDQEALLHTPAMIPLGMILMTCASSVTPTNANATNMHAMATTKLANVYPAE